MKIKPAYLSLVAIALLLGCVQTGLPEGAEADHRYFAAVADYTQAKTIAAKYAAEPTTPPEHVEAILAVVEEGDARVKEFDELRLGAGVLGHDYDTAAGALRATSAILRRLAVEEGNRWTRRSLCF